MICSWTRFCEQAAVSGQVPASRPGNVHINFTQTIESDRCYLAFAAILDELGIPCEKLPYESYLNPVVELPPEQR